MVQLCGIFGFFPILKCFIFRRRIFFELFSPSRYKYNKAAKRSSTGMNSLYLIVPLHLLTSYISMSFKLSDIFIRKRANPTPQKHIFCLMTTVDIRDDLSMCRFFEWIEYHLLMGVEKIYVTGGSRTVSLRNISHSYDGKIVAIDGSPSMSNSIDTKGLFEVAKKSCIWLGYIGIDQYITLLVPNRREKRTSTDTATTVDDGRKTLIDVLSSVNDSFVRIPWWTMTSGGRVARADGLLIDGFSMGYLQQYALATFARTDCVLDWNESKYPYVKDGNKPYKFNLTRAQYFQSQSLHDTEKITLFVNNKGFIVLPRAQIFVKHYWYLSWEEYLHKHHVEARTLGEESTLWHGLWSYHTNRESRLSNGFTDYMASGVKAKINALARSGLLYPHMQGCLHYWNMSQPLDPRNASQGNI